MITIEQMRAGRAMARLTQARLVAQAGISTTAMNKIEHRADARLSAQSEPHSKERESSSTRTAEASASNRRRRRQRKNESVDTRI